MKGIIMKSFLAQAAHEGKKTKTRRIVELKHHFDYNWKLVPVKEQHLDIPRFEMRCGTQYALPTYKPNYTSGEYLYIKETYYAFGHWVEDDGKWSFVDETKLHGHNYRYEALELLPKEKRVTGICKWYKRPSLYMPKQAARTIIYVKSVQAERLQDITEDDARAEGVYEFENDEAYKDYMYDVGSFVTARGSFSSLWQSINGLESWDQNHWVWVVEFERINYE